MKNISYKLILLRILLLLFIVMPLFVFSKGDNQKTVLYVSSFGKETSWNIDSQKALMERFKEEKFSIKLLELYLDEEKNPNIDDRLKIAQNYFANLKEKIDVILVFDYGATNVFLRYTDSIISKIPIVFISESEPENENDSNNITGIISDYGIAQNYKLGLKMFPNTKKVYVWADKSPTGVFFLNQARRTLKGYKDGIEIEFGLDVNNKKELIEKLSSIDPNSIIIFSTWAIDNNGRVYSDEELIPLFFGVNKAPIFCSYDDNIDIGYIGGFVQRPTENAYAVANKAIRIFNGEFPNRMVTEHVNPIPIFNYEQIIRMDGNAKVLPTNAIIVNKLQGLILTHKGLLIILLVLVIVITAVIAIVIYQKRKNKDLIKTIDEKDEKGKQLEQNVKMLSQAMPTLKMMSWTYDERTSLFKYDSENENGVLELNQEGYFDFIRQHISADNLEPFYSLLKNMKNLENHYQFHIEYYGTIPGEEQKSWWEIRGTINVNEDKKGEYRVINGIHLNIDKFKQIEARLNEALEKSIQSDKLKSSFISNITHEIRTPLNAIIGFSNLLISSTNDEEKKEYIRIVQENNDSLLNTVNDIINLSEIQSGCLEIKRIKFDLKQYFDETENLFKHKLKEGVELIIDSPHKSCIIFLDKVLVAQILKVFIDNAINFTSKGFIKIGYSVVDNGIRFYCQDTGIGIKEENLKKIFNHFEKTDPITHGTGLGLTIARSIMDITDTKYGVESEEGKGSTFWFWRPSKLILIDDEHEKETNIEVDNDIEIKTKILIVEEDGSACKLLESILKDRYILSCSNNTLESVEKIGSEMPDIIVMGLKSNNIDGYEAIKRIKQNNINTPIIVISNKVLIHEKQLAYEAGCDQFIEKPLDKDLLINIINNIKPFIN